MPTIVFYISGHGFGHASRDIEVLNALARARNDLRLVARTSAAKWLFDLTVDAPIEFNQVETDTGIVQIDSLHLDADETVRRATAFMHGFGPRVEAEAAWLTSANASLVVSDLPPLGIAAANRAGLPAIALGNFTWDWVYAAYDGGDGVARAISEVYATADLALRLPLHGGFESFARITDIPFVARRSQRDPMEIRRALGLPERERLVLVSFGGYGLEGLDLDALRRLEGYVVLVSGSVPLADLSEGLRGGRRGSLLPLDERAMYAAGFRYEDVVRAVDVVVTKPGYGIISECVANDTALLYTSRGHFIEYEVLVREMPRYVRARFIDHTDLFTGRWKKHLDALLAQPAPPERPSVDGAAKAAELLLAI